jgi:hypothetical protein
MYQFQYIKYEEEERVCEELHDAYFLSSAFNSYAEARNNYKKLN